MPERNMILGGSGSQVRLFSAETAKFTGSVIPTVDLFRPGRLAAIKNIVIHPTALPLEALCVDLSHAYSLGEALKQGLFPGQSGPVLLLHEPTRRVISDSSPSTVPGGLPC